MFRRQTRVMLQHQDLQFDEFLDERSGLGTLRFNVDSAITEIVPGPICDDIIDIPECRPVLHIFVSIDLLLAKSPFW